MRNILMKIITSAACLCGIVYTAHAQSLESPKKNEVILGNTQISREDQELVIDYNIVLGDNVLSCIVDVVLNVDNHRMRISNSEDITGDYGKITRSGSKQIRFNVDRMKHDLANKSITFTLNVRSKEVLKGKTIAVASAGIFPQISYGAMVGYVKKVGGYAKFRSDFSSISHSYSCTSDGRIDEGLFWASGRQKKSRMQATTGMLFRISKSVYPYVGAGYGSRGVYWEDNNGSWAQVTDYSCKGVAAEAGIIFKLGPVAVSAGVSTTAFKYCEAEIGIGMMF